MPALKAEVHALQLHGHHGEQLHMGRPARHQDLSCCSIHDTLTLDTEALVDPVSAAAGLNLPAHARWEDIDALTPAFCKWHTIQTALVSLHACDDCKDL